MEHKKILVLADDLSGAADCALGFVQAGMRAVVLLDHAAGQASQDVLTQVVSIDADTRRMKPVAAAQAQRVILERYFVPGQRLYKKIDSTLRGNVAAELAPVIAAVGMAIIAPAFPKAGRTTRSGHQVVHGVPLEATAIWRSGDPTGSAHIPAMLAAGGVESVALSLAMVRQPQCALRRQLLAWLRSGVQAVVCDAEVDEDLQRIVQASMALTEPMFWVGSAGLSDQIAVAIGTARLAPPEVGAVSGSIVTVVGSFAELSRRQAACLRSSRRLTDIAVTAEVLRRTASPATWQRLQQDVLHAIRQGADLLLTIDEVDLASGGGLQLCQGLAALLPASAAGIGALVLTGGETARAVLSALNVCALFPLRQIESGVPLSRSCGGADIPVITKAGAFGSDDALVRCYDTLCQTRSQSGSPVGQWPVDAGPTVF